VEYRLYYGNEEPVAVRTSVLPTARTIGKMFVRAPVMIAKLVHTFVIILSHSGRRLLDRPRLSRPTKIDGANSGPAGVQWCSPGSSG